MYAVNMLYWHWLISKAVFGQWLGTIELIRKYKLNIERKEGGFNEKPCNHLQETDASTGGHQHLADKPQPSGNTD